MLNTNKGETMHYMNGREAKVGDSVVGKDTDGRIFAGVLHTITPGSDTCNGGVFRFVQVEGPAYGMVMANGSHEAPFYVTPTWTTVSLKDLVHAEDALAGVVLGGEAKAPE